MNYWKRYKNELIVGIAGLLLLIAFIYKQGQVSSQNTVGQENKTSLEDLKEIISLKNIWGDKRTTKKVDKLKTIISPSKVTWSRKSKKLQASFKNLSASELNRLVVKIMNLAIEIQKLEVKKSGASYFVELKCKW